MERERKNTVTEISYILQQEEGTTEKTDSLSSLPQALFNYINSIVGSGIIGIPYALHRAGFGLGLLLLMVVAVITDYSLILMVRCGHISGRFSYPGIMEAAYGKWGYYLLSVLQFMYPMLAMISYNVVVGDTLSKVLIRFLPAWDIGSMGTVRFLVVFVVTVCVVIPLCLYKNVSRLARASFLSLACVVFILFAVILKFISGDYDVVPSVDSSWRFANIDVIPAIGLMAFAFMCHHNTFLVYQSIRGATLERWEKVTHISIAFAWAVAALFGITGYATFKALSQGDLLENYCWDDDLMNFARVLFSVSILLTFPIECFVSREIVKNQIHRYQSSTPVDSYEKDSDPTHALGEDNDVLSTRITLAIVLTAFLISPMTECLGPVLELNGLLAAIPLAYVLPGLAYIQMESHSLFSREKLPAVGLVAFGTIVTILGSASLLVPSLTGDCKSNIVLDYCKNYGS
ncbi:putative sodium-coupled neutral amino acid transporter 11 [Sitodiplosis mosellana]|uniref:putative sodium-coupled neutral amino acid transporter 11 n=1 Tax=Sitodiplosis mosellana TaxID=263140 RepID=UPI002444D062|nr:putative sodium-coupled neutral amino acid transporter 11 [Sitodiplosis mosellana]XP_055310713.1 putative sodium-coupled neutral amino acid transporter 11 [Sitodiplosis mosellana]XP_055310714.1 putative sodium-coupled neutral amino acid transporter 11 [Sitodiplosis mosellana]XP_055310715.1 putative sodium-coupled neutral amino acid transporter 11 [Sitodiplosis mosellana]XP_055310716.1 putative sodium-coupled neutral amino acid transporter 11 [Sitodiplosis mosellana]